MIKKLQNKKVVNPQSRGGSTTHKLSSINIDRTKVFIFVFLLGFWRAGEGQTVFNNPVGINISPLAEFHVVGDIRFQGLNTTTTLNEVISIDNTTGELFRRAGIPVAPGTVNGQSLYWNNATGAWLSNSFLRNTPTGVGVNTLPAAGVDFHVNGQVRFQGLNFSTGVQRYLTWQANGDIGWQNGIMPLPGASQWETLYWNGTDWQNTDYLKTMPGSGVGINLPTFALPTSELHVNGDVRFENLSLSTSGLAEYLTIDGGGNIGRQIGIAPMPGGNPGETLYWNGMDWQPNSILYVDPTSNFVGVNTSGSFSITGNNINPFNPPTGAPVVFSANGTGEFNGDLHILGAYFEASDETIKEDFQDLDWRRVLDVPAYSYKFKQNGEFNFSKTKSYGFKAQEVKQYIPELVTHNGKFHLVNYTGFIPFLTQGLQEHDVEIQELRVENGELKFENYGLTSRIETLENEKEQLERRLKTLEDFVFGQQGNTAPLTENTFEQAGTLNQPASLEQNEPNPFTQETVIRFFVPENIKGAKIEVKNTKGKTVGSFEVQSSGHGSITLKAGSLASGTYFYSLIVEEKTVETKKMILLN